MTDQDFDVGFEKLRELIKYVDYDFSESDTRAKIIDPLFTECLGWKEEDIIREPHINEGYLDYLFSIDGYPKFVLEAKKIGKSFIIPFSLKTRNYKISGTITTDRKVKDAIEKAHKYCIDSGVRYAVISNGCQLIIFEAFKHGGNWRDSECIVFKSLKDIEDNFALFWNFLSRESVMHNSLKRHVSREESHLLFTIPREKIHAKDSTLARNDLNPFLQPFLRHSFEDLTDEMQLDVLEKCYVCEKQYQDADIQIGHHFDRPPDFAKRFEVEMVVESKTYAGKFQERYEKCVDFLSKKIPQGSLIVLMGGIGSGKTTFVHYFFKFVIESANTIWFYVDFTKTTPDSKQIEQYIYRSITQDFEKKYLDKLNGLSEHLNAIGINFADPTRKDIIVLISELARKGYVISLVLDNVDQLGYAAPEYQENVLQIASSLTDTLKTITIVTLREESFFKSTLSGVLDAFLPAVFHISYPNYEKLIRLRVNYVLDLLEKDDPEIDRKLGSTLPLGSNKLVIKRVFEVVRDSISSLRPRGKEILKFLAEISGGDMRVALYFFRIFLISGNTDVSEMLSISSFRIPLHHVIKSIILEHSRLYSGSKSRIMNLFDVNPQHTNSHFLHLRILEFLHGRLIDQTPHGRGYVEIDRIITKGEEMMITREAIADSIKRMAMYGLVEFENQSKTGYDLATYVRLKNTGIYYLKDLTYKFQYLDLVWMDTPIAYSTVEKTLLKYVVETKPMKSRDDLEDRFYRTQIFLEYLKDREEKEFKNEPQLKESDFTCKVFMPEIIKSFEEQKEYITSKRHNTL